MKLEFSRQFFEKYLYIKFHENPSSGSRVVKRGQMDGRADMTKLIVAFRNFAKAILDRPQIPSGHRRKEKSGVELRFFGRLTRILVTCTAIKIPALHVIQFFLLTFWLNSHSAN